jgi:hypothetical protein
MRLFSHLRQKQVETANHAIARQDEFLARYLAWLEAQPEQAPDARRLTILARSPISSVVRAIVGRAGDLRARGVMVKALLARVDPDDSLRELAATLTTLTPHRPLDELMRWADNRCLLEAHEQLTLGPAMCWSGDMMRRDPAKRDGLDLFEADAPHTVRLGALAFDAIWNISAAVPAARLSSRPARPNGSYERAMDEAMPKPAFLRPSETPRFVRH